MPKLKTVLEITTACPENLKDDDATDEQLQQ